MNEKYFLWNLKLNDELTTSLTGQIITIALGVAAICFVCSLAYNYFKNGFETFVSPDKGSGGFPDYLEIGRAIVIMLMIVMYLPISKTIVSSIETINSATAVPASFSKNYAELMKKYDESNTTDIDEMTVAAAKEEVATNGENKAQAQKILNDTEDNTNGKKSDDVGGVWDSAAKSLTAIETVLNPGNLVPLLLHSLCSVLFAIIKWIILGVCVVIVKVLVILGPLAFAFSILPVFKKQMEIWFSTLVTTAMVFTTINIIDAIVGSIFVFILDPTKSDTMAPGEVLALDIIILILYCSSFWLTSKIVGKGDAGRIISKMVGTAAAAAGLAMSGGASAGASNVKNAASTGANVIENGTQE